MKAIFHVIKPPTFISVFCIQDLNTRIHVRPAAQLASAYSASPLNQLHFITSLDLSINRPRTPGNDNVCAGIEETQIQGR